MLGWHQVYAWPTLEDVAKVMPLLLDSDIILLQLVANLDAIPNEIEASFLSGVKVVTMADAEMAAVALMKRGVKNVLITMGAQGVFVKTEDRQVIIPACRVNAVDTTGAGDAFIGGFVTALAEGRDIFEAALFGNAVAALSVTKYGTAPAMPYRKDVDRLLEQEERKVI